MILCHSWHVNLNWVARDGLPLIGVTTGLWTMKCLPDQLSVVAGDSQHI